MRELGVVGPFVTCVADYGTAVVIPGSSDEACDVAGLARFDGRIPAELLAARDAEDALAAQLVEGECFDEPGAVRAARTALDAHGLEGWEVTVSDPSGVAAPRCGVFAFDEATDSVAIVWIPELSS